ncbi:MAG: N-acetylmuramoyl-L-alanine amidase [Ruminococcaceae bacterium]|nr:N-acetylmuramoyl-L-alanine amidase [Oscillospiraceae bacterium]
MKTGLLKVFAGVMTAAMLLSNVVAYAEEATDTTSGNVSGEVSEEESEETTPQIIKPMLSLPENLRATILNIGDISEEDYEKQLAEKLDELASYGLNGVYISPYGDVSCFDTNMNNENDRLKKTLETVSKYGLQKFVYFDISKVLESCPDTEYKNDYLVSEAHKFALKYPCNGIILTGFYGENTNEYYEEYMKTGSGIGYKNWLYDVIESRFKMVCDVIHLTDNTIAVGLDASDVWANAETDERGSETYSDFEALKDGFADTKTYIEKKYVDFISADASGSITDEIIPFETVTGWWDSLSVTTGVPVYFVHHNEKLGMEDGWLSEDQLLKQMAIVDAYDNCNGSIFYSLESLAENAMGTTDTLVKYFNEQINVDSLFEELVMTSPYYLNYSTDEPSATFMGTFDENFDVYFDGEKLELNEAGNFYFEKPLEIGMNTFSISHKDKYLYYNIERRINVLKSVGSAISEGKVMHVDGETYISVLAVAYKGANVTATINGTTIKLKENTKSDDVDINSSYASFTGKYKVPKGIIGEEQYLGNIEITASYSGYSRTYIGAEVIVNKVEPPKEEVKIETEIPEDQSSFGTGEIVGTLSAGITEDKQVSFIKINKNFAYIFDGYNTDSVNPPDCGQLPEGTLDYYDGGWDEYYTTLSGKRFLAEDCELVEGVGLGQNPLYVNSIGNMGGDSIISMKLEDRITFTVTPIGNEYYSGYDGDFYLDDFTADYIYITFDNVTSVTALPSFENCSVFSAGKWEQVIVGDIPKFRLVLKLRQPGVYAGNSATYDEEGNLNFKFQILTNDITNMTVVIDPGHGKTEYEWNDPGAIGHIEEAGANLAVAKLVEAKLKARGVNVVRLQTENYFFDTIRRPYYARDYGCDLYLAIHSNKAGSESARGTECYYYTSYSQPLAEAITNSVSSYFTNNVYYDGKDCNRGDMYSYMWTTKQQDFPSVLLEMGFVSNYEDAMALADPNHQEGIAQAIVDGIVTYLQRSAISSY